MLFFIESMISCILFTVMIIIPLGKNPVGQIMSYPIEIRRRVESLPQYQNTIMKKEKRHIKIKVIGVLVFSAIAATIAYFSGVKTFKGAFIYIFLLFMVVNLYDLFVMDIGIFMHCKKFWIPGTEDMVKEYHNPLHHIVGAIKGTVIGLFVSLLAAALVHLMSFYL